MLRQFLGAGMNLKSALFVSSHHRCSQTMVAGSDMRLLGGLGAQGDNFQWNGSVSWGQDNPQVSENSFGVICQCGPLQIGYTDYHMPGCYVSQVWRRAQSFLSSTEGNSANTRPGLFPLAAGGPPFVTTMTSMPGRLSLSEMTHLTLSRCWASVSSDARWGKLPITTVRCPVGKGFIIWRTQDGQYLHSKLILTICCDYSSFFSNSSQKSHHLG